MSLQEGSHDEAKAQESIVWWQRQRTEWCSCRAKNAKNWTPSRTGKKRQGSLLLDRFQRDCGPTNSLISMFQHPDSELIKFYCIRLPSLWYFVTKASGNEYRLWYCNLELATKSMRTYPLTWNFTSKTAIHKNVIWLIKTESHHTYIGTHRDPISLRIKAKVLTKTGKSYRIWFLMSSQALSPSIPSLPSHTGLLLIPRTQLLCFHIAVPGWSMRPAPHLLQSPLKSCLLNEACLNHPKYNVRLSLASYSSLLCFFPLIS
jgi:hypothetical protein